MGRHTRRNTCTPIGTYTCTQAYVHAYMHAHMHTHIDVHVHVQKCMRASRHIHTGIWWLLVGLCVLVPPPTSQGGPEEVTPSVRTEELGHQDGDPPPDPQRCGITFHTPSPCSPRGLPSSSSSASRRELDHLKNLLQDTKASLREVEEAATQEDNGTRYQDIITEALPAIRGANLEFQESLDNVRRELEAHVAKVDHPRTAEKKEKLWKGVRVVAHMLRLTSHLAQTLDATSHRLHAELSQRLQSSATRVTAATAQP
ncbi:PREDICTED: uncharacterized protein LOC106899177 [Calidris pugnax]|uniref:uncharacterized protein LOC106899177 n=1 Tax=Calidris pugnax TaxID=198806 RepID=UPI00071D042A|nr:PREDICTED: uncharacterized protein LOC106899177 [Calidris pugnax]